MALGDHKVTLVPATQRMTHHQILKLTLARLSEELVNQGCALDAIVVTGDVADKNNDGGYLAFQELIDTLGPARPTSDRILCTTW